MALNDIQISGLPNNTTVDTNDLFVFQRGGSNYNIKIDDMLFPHSSLVNNPHNVTQTQVGLSNISNYTISDSFLLDSSTSYASSKALFEGLADNANTSSVNLNLHISDAGNPHLVTKTQVGLSNVQNYSSTSNVGTATNLYATQLATLNSRDEAIGSSNVYTDIHADNTNNPHDVDKTHVGLSNVQNYPITDFVTLGNSNYYASSKAVTDSFYASQQNSEDYTDAHANRTDDPHNVTQSQVGLSNVPNWNAGSTNMGNSSSTFPNEQSVRDYIDSALDSYFNKTMPIGMTVALSYPSNTPTSLGWLGVWEELPDETTLRQASGTDVFGTVTGSNDVQLNSNNIPAHSHPDSFSLTDSGHEHDFTIAAKGVLDDVNNTGSADVQSAITIQVQHLTTDSSTSGVSLNGVVQDNVTTNSSFNIKSKYLPTRYWRRVS